MLPVFKSEKPDPQPEPHPNKIGSNPQLTQFVLLADGFFLIRHKDSVLIISFEVHVPDK